MRHSRWWWLGLLLLIVGFVLWLTAGTYLARPMAEDGSMTFVGWWFVAFIGGGIVAFIGGCWLMADGMGGGF